MSLFELGLQLVAGVEPDPTLGALQAEFPKPDLAPGWLDKRVVLQDRVWITRELRVIPLPEMTPSHRSNVVRFLRRHEPGWQLDAVAWLYLETRLGLHSPAAVRERASALVQLTPGWSTRTPLVRRLLDLNASQAMP